MAKFKLRFERYQQWFTEIEVEADKVEDVYNNITEEQWEEDLNFGNGAWQEDEAFTDPRLFSVDDGATRWEVRLSRGGWTDNCLSDQLQRLNSTYDATQAENAFQGYLTEQCSWPPRIDKI